MTDTTNAPETTDAGQTAGTEVTEAPKFTQADVDRMITERLERDRKSRDLSPDEVKALKQQAAKAQAEADASKTEAQKAAERLAELEAAVAANKLEALRAKVQARYGIDDDDADLFLTATDEAALVKQAERLAERTSGPQAPGRGNFMPREGSNPKDKTSLDKSEFLRQLRGQ